MDKEVIIKNLLQEKATLSEFDEAIHKYFKLRKDIEAEESLYRVGVLSVSTGMISRHKLQRFCYAINM